MKDDAASPYVVLGRFGAPYGIKGWMRIISFTDPRENILGYRHFLLREAGGLREIEIDEGRPQGKGLVVHVKGCDDRDGTRAYTGRELLVEKSALPELESGSYYWYQLEGLRVLTLGGEELGTVDHLIETGANDVLVVKPTSTSLDDQERLIPYLVERVVREVDLDAGLLHVDWQADY